MDKSRSPQGRCILAAMLGVLADGLAVAALTRAVPAMMSRVLPTMMHSMMQQMGSEGCEPEDM